MRRVVLLDTGVLGMVTSPKKYPDIEPWLERLAETGTEVLIPEISDYELRRGLLRCGDTVRVQRLDELKRTLSYEPITTGAMLQAAEFWAKARIGRYQTADDKALDADVILAAQASQFSGEGCDVIVATDNVDHLSRYVSAKRWDEIC